MILTALTLEAFRSYHKRSFTFSPETTLLVGPNAAGKTNVLEAIHMLALGKSFRADEDWEIVRWGSEIARLRGRVASQDGETKLELVVTRGEVGGQKTPMKKHLVNGIARRQMDFVGNLRAVLFWPEDLELITDSPSLRRKYLDSVLVQTDREYRRNLLSYERGVRQRNKLLDMISEGTASASQLLFWNQLLIKSGGFITDTRASYIAFVNAQRMRAAQFEIVYDKSVISASRLSQYATEEIAAKVTLVGPHRDDFSVKLQAGGVARDLSKFGSRGEQRLGVLWLKMAEVSFIEHQTGVRPILLLDDIFSELDAPHRKLVLALVSQQQTIITSASEDIIRLLPNKAAIIRV
jgi:DNA replication and repair protein RecF